MIAFDFVSEPGQLTVKIRGELEYSAIEACLPLMAEFKQSEAKKFVAELSGLEFIDSSGLGILISIRNSAQKTGAEFVIRGAKDQVAQALQTTRFDILATLEK